MARQVAQLDVDVLLDGETGTGKSTIAQLIHNWSPRAASPFVGVNCAEIPANLIESILYGFERGAFSGADRATPGKFEQANGGTLFLDEIGEISHELQAKLLTSIESKSITRLQGRRPVGLDLRLIYATNRPLAELRQDLLYRIDEARITIPPLRERPEDIPSLLDHYFAVSQEKIKRAEPFTLDEGALSVLCRYEWPGNIRQLRTVVLKVALVCNDEGRSAVTAPDVGGVLRRRSSDRRVSGEVLAVEDLAVEAAGTCAAVPPYEKGTPLDVYLARVLLLTYEELHRVQGLPHNEVARIFCMNRGTLYSRIRAAEELLSEHSAGALPAD